MYAHDHNSYYNVVFIGNLQALTVRLTSTSARHHRVTTALAPTRSTVTIVLVSLASLEPTVRLTSMNARVLPVRTALRAWTDVTVTSVTASLVTQVT